MEEAIEKIEDYLLDLVSRIDSGDESALKEIKAVKRAVADLNDILSFVDENDSIESLRKKMDEMEKKFDEFMMELAKVVG